MMRHNSDAVVGNSMLYYEYDNHIYAYNSASSSWSEIPPVLTQRFAMAVTDGPLTVVGGLVVDKTTNKYW